MSKDPFPLIFNSNGLLLPRSLPQAFQLTCNYYALWGGWGWWGPIRPVCSETFPLCGRQCSWDIRHNKRYKHHLFVMCDICCFWNLLNTETIKSDRSFPVWSFYISLRCILKMCCVFLCCSICCCYIREAVLNTFYLEMLSQRHSNITADGFCRFLPSPPPLIQRSVFSDLFMWRNKLAFFWDNNLSQKVLASITVDVADVKLT